MGYQIQSFIACETGAVGTDWAVLTAGVMGIGIATITGIAQGMNDLTQDTSDGISGSGTAYSQTGSVDGFGDGPGDWNGGDTAFVDGFGYILGPIEGTEAGNETVHQDFAVDPGVETATFSFDLLLMDSIDGGTSDDGWGSYEGPAIFIDGVEVARARATGGSLEWQIHDNAGITIESTETISGQNIGGPSSRTDWYDGISAVEVTVTDPNENVRLGFGFKANQGIEDESIGIDNFQVQML